MSHPRILSVGQCAMDHGTISRHMAMTYRAEVTGVATREDALERLRSGAFDLVLVNRIGDRDGARGVDLIRVLKTDPSLAEVPVMLVSNFPDAQAQAVELGALPGFGKAQLRDPDTHERLATHLGVASL